MACRAVSSRRRASARSPSSRAISPAPHRPMRARLAGPPSGRVPRSSGSRRQRRRDDPRAPAPRPDVPARPHDRSGSRPVFGQRPWHGVRHAHDVLLLQSRDRPGGRLKELGGRLAGVTVPPAQPPVRGQRGDQPQRRLPVVRHGPAQRGHQVAVIGGEPGQPEELFGPAKVGIGALGQAEEVPGVEGGQVIALSGLGQPFGAEQRDRVEHPVPAAAHLDQRLVHQIGQQFGGALHLADRLDRLRGGASREHGEPSGQRLLPRREEVPAPLHRRAQGPMPGRRRTVAA